MGKVRPFCPAAQPRLRRDAGLRFAQAQAGLARTAALVTVLCGFTVTMSGRLSAQALQTPVPHVILIDAETLSVLYQKDADALVEPASTAKIMTAEMVFEALAKGRLKLTDKLIVSQDAWRNGGAPAHGSTMFAKLHSKIDVDDLLRGLIVVSGNDAAIVFAEALAGSEGAFATKMTERARQLGFKHLTFTNYWGRDDPDKKVTPREMALLAAHLIKTYPQYYHYFGEKSFTWNKIRQPNRNPLLTMDIGADGLKTGYIKGSGYDIVASAVQNGERLIVALYGAKTAQVRAMQAARILQWGFVSFQPKTLFAKGEVVGTAQVFGGAAGSVPLVTAAPVKVLVPHNVGQQLSAQIVYQGPLIAPVAAGKKVAELQIFRGGDKVRSAPLYTGAAVSRGSLPRRALDAGFAFFGDLFRNYVLKAVFH